MDADTPISFFSWPETLLEDGDERTASVLSIPAAVCMTLPSHRTHLVRQALLNASVPHMKTDFKLN